MHTPYSESFYIFGNYTLLIILMHLPMFASDKIVDNHNDSSSNMPIMDGLNSDQYNVKSALINISQGVLYPTVM